MTATVLTTRDGPVATVTLHRPERLNAIDGALLVDLRAALATVHDDPAIRAIVLTGSGRAFCSGDDLRDFDRQVAEARAHVEAIQDVSRQLLLGPKPVVAAVRGWAVGGGLEWMIDCDFAVMAEGTRCFFPEIGLGLFVTGGVTALLPRLVGVAKARQLLLFGERFDAAAALAMGLAWKVVPDADLLPTALAAADRLAALPANAVAALRRALVLGLGATLDQAMAAETAATLAAFRDPTTAGRIARFTRSDG
ncbi:MAG: enoyl-CoA hydratase/isomerase family protein [Alphaproteobacteria bacterium]|nr:enoyl-CoA hydratase/isomerase family protein [Alphaproteobacteria bacterium]